MSSRSIAFQLTVTLCWLSIGTPTVGVTTADAGPFFRSSSSQKRPTQSYRSRFSPKSTPEPKEETAADRYKALFENVETPPAAPKADAIAKSTNMRLPQLTGRLSDTEKMVDEAVLRTKKRYLTAGEHTPWQILHGTLALRHEFLIRDGDKLVRSLDWLRNGMMHDGLPLVEKTEHGARCHPFTVPWAFEGHKNQFLAILSLSSLPEEYQFRTPKGEIVDMGDMVRHAQKSMDGRGEMTWTLWFLTHYVEPDAEWETATGQFWSMERLVRMEARQKINGAPCGGTHRLFALSLARNSYLAKHGNVRSAWLEADQVIRKYVATIRSIQNRDGSFSSDWFKGRGYSTDLTTRLKTSGHTLEWLMVALSEKQLNERWVQLAVQSVARDVIRSSREPAECGALYHALDALTFYKQRKHPAAVPREVSPTYLVSPTAPQSQVVDTAPGRSLPKQPQTQFEQPKTIRPAQPGSTIPRMVSIPDEGVRPLAGTADEAASEPKPVVSAHQKPNSLVVEEVDPATGLPVESATPQTSTAPAAAPVVETPSTVAIDVPVVVDADDSLIPRKVSALPERTMTADEVTTENEPSTEPAIVVAPTEETPVEDIPAMVVVPADVAPLATKLPSKPDAEADPRVVESAEPSPTMNEAEPDEPTAIEGESDTPQLAEEPTSETVGMKETDSKPVADAAPETETSAAAEGPEAAVTSVVASKPEQEKPVSEPAEASPEPTELKVAEKDAAAPRQMLFDARELETAEAEAAESPSAASTRTGRVELRRRRAITPQVVITPSLPKLPAPKAPTDDTNTSAEPDESDVERVAAEPQAPQAMNRPSRRPGGLIVIQIEDYEEIPILVPMKNANTIRRASGTW